MLLHLLLFYILPAASSAAANAPVAATALPGCSSSCGNVSIPYPFGTTPGCHLPGFLITCNTSYNPPKPFISTTTIEVSSISLDAVTILTPIARDCYAPLALGADVGGTTTDVTGLPYTFSHTRNRFTALGCDTVALSYQGNFVASSSGCVSFCSDPSAILNGTCSGIGCCQTAIPRGIQRIDTILRSLLNHSNTWAFSPCSYGFLVDQQQFVFNLTDLVSFHGRSSMPVVLDWSIASGNDTCEVASGSASYACGDNTDCTTAENGPGYRCSCKDGYSGNPYLGHGCQDINECENPATNPCSDICENTPGSYICSCPHGFHGDARKSGNGCIKKTKRFPVLQVVLGIGLGFLFLLVSGTWLWFGLKKRRLMQQKEHFFIKNGGLLLQQQIASHEGESSAARIFTAEELRLATDNYSDSCILGDGGYGVVYKGILPDSRVVAIKKSRVMDSSQIEQFINEVVILSQVVHKNVVRILGCCLETPVPLLVYEYVSNGTLGRHIHHQSRFGSLAWEARLRIAAETAGALAYLHSATATTIFHRDVKSANILLDMNYMAKVADFGASRLVPHDRAQITTLVQGTLGYLDPEYFQTGQMTEKSDVYSFGVVAAELLTGKMPMSETRPQEEQNLAIHFLLRMREGRLEEILEPRVRNEGSNEQLKAVAEVVRRCLKLKGEERPGMAEVAAELEKLRRQGHGEGENGSLINRHEETAYHTAPITGDEELDAHIFLALEMQRR